MNAALRYLPGLVVLSLLGCAGMAQGSKISAPEGVAAFYGDGDEIRVGAYVYNNNQWGKAKASGDFWQCLTKRRSAAGTQFGWAWSWPGIDPTVFAYPEIIYGWKPWSGGASTDPRLPMKVADVRRMQMRFAVDIDAKGAWNVAPEVWLSRSGTATEEPDSGSITTEIMFWMDSHGMQPAGMRAGTVTVDGGAYTLWKYSSMGVGTGTTGWLYLAFVSATPRREGTIDLAAFFRALLDKGLISGENWVTSIEFGTEIAGGAGSVWVRDYEVAVE
jgi:hypothetical protein